MTGRVVDSLEVSERFLWDLRQTAQELVIENHAEHLKALGRRHGFGLSIEPYDMNPCADLSLGGVADVPMCEFWAQGYGFDTAFSCIEAVSIAHTLGRPIVAAESFTSGDKEAWQLYPGDHEGAGRLGVLHGHQPARLPPLRTPAVAGPLARHDDGAVRRPLRTHADLVAHGRGVARVPGAVPVHAAARAAGGGHLLPRRRRARRTSFARLPRPCRGRGPCRTAGATTSTAARRRRSWRATVKDGQLVLPDGMSYRVLVLPEMETMTPTLLRKIQRPGPSRRDRDRAAAGEIAEPERLSEVRSKKCSVWPASCGQRVIQPNGESAKAAWWPSSRARRSRRRSPRRPSLPHRPLDLVSRGHSGRQCAGGHVGVPSHVRPGSECPDRVGPAVDDRRQCVPGAGE